MKNALGPIIAVLPLLGLLCYYVPHALLILAGIVAVIAWVNFAFWIAERIVEWWVMRHQPQEDKP
jgi:hypothetical protein